MNIDQLPQEYIDRLRAELDPKSFRLTGPYFSLGKLFHNLRYFFYYRILKSIAAKLNSLI